MPSLRCALSSDDRQPRQHPKTVRHCEHSGGKKAPTKHRIHGRWSSGGSLRVFWDQVAARLRSSLQVSCQAILSRCLKMVDCPLTVHGTCWGHVTGFLPFCLLPVLFTLLLDMQWQSQHSYSPWSMRVLKTPKLPLPCAADQSTKS